jgi:sphinganine-1-phosphate aldolase
MRATDVLFPEHGQEAASLLSEIRAIKEEDAAWKSGRMLGYIYYPGDETAEVIQEVYQMFSSVNALNPSLFTSLLRFENETVAMVAELLNAGHDAAGNLTSGGTESILMAVKTFRDKARADHPEILKPEILVPASTHPAFDKAAHFLNVKIVHAPLRPDKRVDIVEMEKLITRDTILLVASAPCYPYGVIDPIEEVGMLALKYDIPLHVDACLGGLLLPFAGMLGYQIPLWDFRVNGVTSISADIHKYGYSPKGASVIIYRNREIRKYQFFVCADWSGGIYGSPTLLGSKSGGPIAAAWAVMKYLGKDGYLRMTKDVMEASRRLQAGIISIDGLRVISNPEMSVFAFTSDTLDIFAIGDEVTADGWHLDFLQLPKCLHVTLSYHNVALAEEFLTQLRKAVAKVSGMNISKPSSHLVVSLIKNLSRTIPSQWFRKYSAGTSGPSGKEVNGEKLKNGAIYGLLAEGNNRQDIHNFVLGMMDEIYSLEHMQESLPLMHDKTIKD